MQLTWYHYKFSERNLEVFWCDFLINIYFISKVITIAILYSLQKIYLLGNYKYLNYKSFSVSFNVCVNVIGWTFFISLFCLLCKSTVVHWKTWFFFYKTRFANNVTTIYQVSINTLWTPWGRAKGFTLSLLAPS